MTAGSPSCSTISFRRGCRRKASRATTSRRNGRTAPTLARDGADARRAGRERQARGAALHRAAGAAQAAGGRAGPRPGRRLRLAHDHRVAAVLAAGEVPCAGRQLGRGDHSAHRPDQARVLPAVRGELQVDGEDEAGHAAPHQDARDVRATTRSKLEPGDDGAVQDREDQPARRLPADRGADPGVHRALLGAARGDRAAPCAVHLLDPRPVGARSVLRAADPDDASRWSCRPS